MKTNTILLTGATILTLLVLMNINNDQPKKKEAGCVGGSGK